jgi:hypothetical protein
MSLWPRRREVFVAGSAAAPPGWPGAMRGGRPSRIWRARRWLRTGALLTILGVLWLARTARSRWEPVGLLAGGLLTVAGFMLPATDMAFFPGCLILIAVLLRGILRSGRDTGQSSGWR